MKLNSKEITQIIESLKARYGWFNDDPEADDSFVTIMGENTHEFFRNLIKKFEDFEVDCQEGMANNES